VSGPADGPAVANAPEPSGSGRDGSADTETKRTDDDPVGLAGSVAPVDDKVPGPDDDSSADDVSPPQMAEEAAADDAAPRPTADPVTGPDPDDAETHREGATSPRARDDGNTATETDDSRAAAESDASSSEP